MKLRRWIEQDTMDANEENIRSFACRVKEDQVVVDMRLKKFKKTAEQRYVYAVNLI